MGQAQRIRAARHEAIGQRVAKKASHLAMWFVFAAWFILGAGAASAFWLLSLLP